MQSWMQKVRCLFAQCPFLHNARAHAFVSGAVSHWGCFKTRQKDSVLLKARAIVQGIEALRNEVELQSRSGKDFQWFVGVEDFLMSYGFGRFQTKGLFTLAQVNGIVSYESLRLFQCEPERVHPSKARAVFGLKKTADQPNIKSVVFDFAKDHIPEDQWKLDKRGEIHKDNFDVTDAYLIARYIYELQQERQKEQRSADTE
jgi:hypothetical protein